MSKKDYNLIATAIWRAGVIGDKNQVRQQAKTDARRLIVNNLIADLKKENPRFDSEEFMKACGFVVWVGF